MLELRTELENLISLTKQLVEQQQKSSSSHHAHAGRGGTKTTASTTSSSLTSSVTLPSSSYTAPAASSSSVATDTHAYKFSPGEECTAKYAGDGKWYPARITSIGGSSTNPVYSIVFKGYNTTEQVTSTDIKPTKENLDAAERKRTGRVLSEQEEAMQAKKKRKTEKWEAKKSDQQVKAKDKQQAWQKFATKGAKKGYAIPAATGKSMFRTPEDPLAKVGIVGAGRGMKETTQRSKHIYQPE